MPLLTQRPRGTLDILPDATPAWHALESRAVDVCRRFGFGEIRTPVFEHAELFVRTSGETTDVLEKETYTFEDRGQRLLTLRPEGTPGVARAFVEGGLFNRPLPAKFYYIGPMFRYDRPQAGRYRQHTQFGAEVFGVPGPEADLEVILLAITFLGELGLRKLRVALNSIGCPACRPAYRAALVRHFEAAADGLCADCRRRLEHNPLRLLDCKEPGCQVFKQAAPRSVDHLCPECRSHFQALQGLLGRFGVDFDLEPALVRGLDYYTRTVFEIVYGGLGAQSAVCGGGRYDGLIEAIGGPPTPAVGYGMGLERVLLTLERESMHLPGNAGPDVFLATAGGADQEVQFRALELLYELRQSGLAAEMDPLGRGLRQQFRQADRLGARLVLTVGPQELETGQVRAKDMSDGSEADVPFSGLGSWVRGYVSGQRQSAVAGAGAPKAREGTP